eukprot:6015512-Amphidinium_carterae.1
MLYEKGRDLKCRVTRIEASRRQCPIQTKATTSPKTLRTPCTIVIIDNSNFQKMQMNRICRYPSRDSSENTRVEPDKRHVTGTTKARHSSKAQEISLES